MLYTFGDCSLNTQLYTLQRAGQALRLRPKVFQVLYYLLQHCDRVIPKQELAEQAWPEQFISDATLESTLRAVRQALGDTGRAQHLIQTLPGHGYRLVAAVEVCSEARPDTPAETAPLEATVVAPTHGTLDPERKPITVFCCTLVRPSVLGEPPDLDTLYRLMRTLSDLAQPLVRRYEGVLQLVVGEHLTALFSVPIAHEDHAVRAVLTAFELQRQVAERHHTASVTPAVLLAVRMSLHTGWVVVEGGGDAAAPSAAVVGDTAVVAAALQEYAAPGTILCNEATARLVQRVVRLVPVPPLAGAATLPWAYQVLRLRLQRSPIVPRGGRRLSPFVGREREPAMLAQAAAGRGQAVGIVGEPGMGKSRLVTEFRRSLPPRTYTYLGGCSPRVEPSGKKGSRLPKLLLTP